MGVDKCGTSATHEAHRLSFQNDIRNWLRLEKPGSIFRPSHHITPSRQTPQDQRTRHLTGKKHPHHNHKPTPPNHRDPQDPTPNSAPLSLTPNRTCIGRHDAEQASKQPSQQQTIQTSNPNHTATATTTTITTTHNPQPPLQPPPPPPPPT